VSADPAGFLAARLDEDEALARRGLEWQQKYPPATGTAAGPLTQFCTLTGVPCLRQNPARVLAEVAAERKILALHHLDHESYLDGDGIERPGHHCWECDQREWPCPTLRALAAVYAGHPDYDPAWKQ
jgi:hypothetical protein